MGGGSAIRSQSIQDALSLTGIRPAALQCRDDLAAMFGVFLPPS
jgi:hypothetical protein